jgi:hypothetical protein
LFSESITGSVKLHKGLHLSHISERGYYINWLSTSLKFIVASKKNVLAKGVEFDVRRVDSYQFHQVPPAKLHQALFCVLN